MRQDVFVDNDSGGLSLTSSSAVERIIDDAREDDAQFAKSHEAVMAMLVGDSSFVARVVVGEPLSTGENEQWIAHYRSALKVPCGRLLVCGGFDPDVLAQWLDEGEHGGVQEVAVPPGHYVVDAYTYLHSMNGRVMVSDEWQEQLGKWFRRDHPGRAFPSWVAGELTMFEDEDPGHEKDWKNYKAAVAEGRLDIELDPLDWVHFVFHLQPYDAAAAASISEDFWFEPNAGVRRPSRFPLGVAAQAKDRLYREALEDLIEDEEDEGEKAPPQRPIVEPIDVFTRADRRPMTPIAGGPVEISPRQMARLYRLPWFATCSAQPEIRVQAGNAGNLAALFDDSEWARATGKGDTLRIGFPDGGRWGILEILGEQEAEKWTFFPSGSVLELATELVGEEDDRETPTGTVRFRGRTEGEVDPCVWRIEESYPPVSAAVLREALALSEAVESDKNTLPLASPEEAQAVRDAYYAEWGQIITASNPVKCDGAALVLEEPERHALHFLGSQAFRLRYAAVWPAPVPLEEDEDDDE